MLPFQINPRSRVSKERFFCLIKSLSDLQSSIVSVGGVLRIIRPNTCFALTNPSPRFILPNYARINETSEKSRRSYESLLERCQTENKDIQQRRQLICEYFRICAVCAPRNQDLLRGAKKIDENEAAMESAARLIPMLRDFI
jgi:hypothetical protein